MNRAVAVTVVGAILSWLVFIGLLWLLVQWPVVTAVLSGVALLTIAGTSRSRRRRDARLAELSGVELFDRN